MNSSAVGWIEPDWPVPRRVRVLCTERPGGVSEGPYAALNLAAHVGDRPGAVAENRRRLREAARLPSEPFWLEQVHGCDVVRHAGPSAPVRADASVATEPGRVCAVLTADCLPVVLADQRGTRVAVAHAGWRGLAGGVLEATVASLDVPAADLCAWLGRPSARTPSRSAGRYAQRSCSAGPTVEGVSVPTRAAGTRPTCTHLRDWRCRRPAWPRCTAGMVHRWRRRPLLLLPPRRDHRPHGHRSPGSLDVRARLIAQVPARRSP